MYRFVAGRCSVQATGTSIQAATSGGGQIFEASWTSKPGWFWRAPFGPTQTPTDAEPAVHMSFHEAQAFYRCLAAMNIRGALKTEN